MREFTGLEYQYISLANHLGFDRIDWDTRIEIGHNTYYSPMREQTLLEAKEPILAAKACRGIDMTVNKQPCNIPVMFDATASGLQILAVLTGCELTAQHTNLINTDERQCVYDNMNKTMSAHCGYEIGRDTLKTPTMTFFYASHAEPEKVFGKDSDELAHFYATLYDELPYATQGMYHMLNWWNNRALDHQWTLPDGHKAYVPVIEKYQSKIECNELGSVFTYQYCENAPSNYNKPLPANIVQSIDGYVVRELRKRCGFPILPIHDCFGVHPNNVNALRYHYLAIFRELAESNLFEQIGRECSGRYLRVPKGTSNLSAMMKDAEYHLS